MSNNETAQFDPKPAKKRHSLWWLWLLLILAAFAGGVIAGLKLNTMPLPTEVKDRLYPVLESYIPGGTTPRTPAAEPAETPATTAAPAETPAPTAAPEATAQVLPASADTPAPALAAAVVPEMTPAPKETAAPAAAAPETVPAPAETPAPNWMTEVEQTVNRAGAAESTPTAAPKYIGVDAALEIAIGHAGVNGKEAEVSGVYRTKNDDGEAVYEVAFHAGDGDYQYEIDALSGEILSWKLVGLNVSDTATFAASFTGNDQTEAEAAAAREMIGEERAKEIAYAHAAVKEAEVLRVQVTPGRTGETASYDVAFRITDRRFDYKIDAYTGDILGFELR